MKYSEFLHHFATAYDMFNATPLSVDDAYMCIALDNPASSEELAVIHYFEEVSGVFIMDEELDDYRAMLVNAIHNFEEACEYNFKNGIVRYYHGEHEFVTDELANLGRAKWLRELADKEPD